jgi:hypothetical protein
MRTCNKEQPLLGSVKHFRRHVFIFAFSALISGWIPCSGQNSGPTIFDKRPGPMNCVDRPSPPPPGEHSFLVVSPQAPFARTRLDTLNLPLYQVPTLTIVAEPLNSIRIVGTNQDHWVTKFCAEGEGDTVDEADSYLKKISMQRTGSLLTLKNTDPHGLTGGHGDLLLFAPTSAPVIVHSDAAVEVFDMAGPVRLLAGLATILNTTGKVDASAGQVFFAGSQGSVSLSASWDISFRLNAQQFSGKLRAYAQRRVRAFFPPGFQTPIEIVVNRRKDFVCRADFCPKMKKERENSLYRFTYGDVANATDHISLRSENSHVSLDTTR